MTFSEPRWTSGRAFACGRTSRRRFLGRFRAFTPSSTGRRAPKSGQRFYLGNKFFEIGDAIILHALLRRFRPKRIIEVGSGFSSALMMDSNDRFLDGSIRFTFIEPYPERLRSLLTDQDQGRIELLETVVQSVHMETFRVAGTERYTVHRFFPRGEDKERRELPCL